MNKLYFAAATALLLATSSAQAGNGISIDFDGNRVRIESPRGCNSLSCITISAPGYKGKLGNIDLGNFGSKDKDDDVSDPPPAKTTTAPAPVQAPAPAPVQTTAVPPPPAPSAMLPAPTAVAAAPVTNDVTRSGPGCCWRLLRLLRLPLPPLRSKLPIRRSASGRLKRTRATCASKPAATISAAMRSRPTNVS